MQRVALFSCKKNWRCRSNGRQTNDLIPRPIKHLQENTAVYSRAISTCVEQWSCGSLSDRTACSGRDCQSVLPPWRQTRVSRPNDRPDRARCFYWAMQKKAPTACPELAAVAAELSIGFYIKPKEYPLPTKPAVTNLFELDLIIRVTGSYQDHNK